MKNAREELINHVNNRIVDYVKVAYKNSSGDLVIVEGSLLHVFSKLNFIYDNGFGSQQLFGFIWYKDGTWSDRDEYDGYEQWKHRKPPDKNIDVNNPALKDGVSRAKN